MPNAVLEGTGSAVLLGCLNLIGRAFARALAADFQRWRSDAAYRQERAGAPGDGGAASAVFLLHPESLAGSSARGVAGPALVGPALFLTVGPSGAGKDTLLSGARLALREESAVVFVPRHIHPPRPALFFSSLETGKLGITHFRFQINIGSMKTVTVAKLHMLCLFSTLNGVWDPYERGLRG